MSLWERRLWEPEAVCKGLKDPTCRIRCSPHNSKGAKTKLRWELQRYRFQLSTRKNLGQAELYGLLCRVVSSPSLQVFKLKLGNQPTGRDEVL